MSSKRTRSCIGFWATLVLAALVQAASPLVHAQSRTWGEGYFPNLPVITHNGETVRFYDDVLKGRIVVISFIFTRCTEICPLNTARKAEVADRLRDEIGRSVHFVSISVDPQNDTPQNLAAYASAFYNGPGWTFLTGTPDNIRAINARLGERMRSLQDHRNEVLIGNEATGTWARNSVFGDLERLVYEIRSMDPVWRAKAQLPSQSMQPEATSSSAASVPGQALFLKLCSSCHTVGQGSRVGPDLKAVGQRRSHDWLVSYITTPARMRTDKDAIALELASRYPAVRMPDLGLSRVDASDLIEFLDQRSK